MNLPQLLNSINKNTSKLFTLKIQTSRMRRIYPEVNSFTLLYLLPLGAEDYPAGLHQIKETSMIKTEYKKGGRPTKGVTEKKKYRITVKLNTQDYYTLKGKAKSAGVTMSEFVRKVLEKGNVIERLTIEQADFIRKLCGMANNLNQLAHCANAEGFHAVAPFYKIIIGKIDEILNLIRR